MKKISFVFGLGFFCLAAAGFGGEPQSKYGPDAIPLSKDSNHEYFVRRGAPDFWALIPYYVGQPNGAACSAAALVTVLNAARHEQPLGPSDKIVTFKSLTENDTDEKYKAQVSGNPAQVLLHHTRFGISVTQLPEVLKEAAEKLKILTPSSAIDLVSIDEDHPEKSKAKFHEDLVKNEKSADDFIILNFIQGRLTGDPEGMVPHMAAVGAYDEKKHLVLILDPDREWYEPYWSPEDKVFEAVADKKSDAVRPGYIYFKVK